MFLGLLVGGGAYALLSYRAVVSCARLPACVACTLYTLAHTCTDSSWSFLSLNKGRGLKNSRLFHHVCIRVIIYDTRLYSRPIRETHGLFVDFQLLDSPEILAQQFNWSVNEQVHVGLTFHVDFAYIFANRSISCCQLVTYSWRPFWRMYFLFPPTNDRLISH